VVHCHDLDTAPAGLAVLKRAAGRPGLVLDMHELYRDSNMVPQRGLAARVARATVRLVERRAFRAADRIIVANPGTVDYYRSLGVGDKIIVVENAPDVKRFGLVARDQGAPFTVGYFGQKRYLEGLRLLMEAIQPHAGMRAVLRGGGVAAGEVAALAGTMERVTSSGAFTYAELPALYAECDVVYAVYDVTLGNVRTLFPVKVMEAMASGLPVIVAGGTWIGDYVAENGIGVAVPSGDREALEAALIALASDAKARAAMGARGRAIVEGGLNWDAATGRLLQAYARWR
jgi:glycosyltransferase involved in cell wall biosynthesis